MPSPLAHFEIQADDPERCAEFYRKCLGWDIKKWEGGQFPYWLVMTVPKGTPGGINGGILPRKGPAPTEGASVNAFVCTITVDNYDEAAKKIEANGGRNVVPKMAFAGMAWQGYFKDTEGNIFGLHQIDTNAK